MLEALGPHVTRPNSTMELCSERDTVEDTPPGSRASAGRVRERSGVFTLVVVPSKAVPPTEAQVGNQRNFPTRHPHLPSQLFSFLIQLDTRSLLTVTFTSHHSWHFGWPGGFQIVCLHSYRDLVSRQGVFTLPLTFTFVFPSTMFVQLCTLLYIPVSTFLL